MMIDDEVIRPVQAALEGLLRICRTLRREGRG